MKFKVISYLQGYSSWNVEVDDGQYDASQNHYRIKVVRGSINNAPIENKTFIFPMQYTIIEIDDSDDLPF